MAATMTTNVTLLADVPAIGTTFPHPVIFFRTTGSNMPDLPVCTFRILLTDFCSTLRVISVNITFGTKLFLKNIKIVFCSISQ